MGENHRSGFVIIQCVGRLGKFLTCLTTTAGGKKKFLRVRLDGNLPFKNEWVSSRMRKCVVPPETPEIHIAVEKIKSECYSWEIYHSAEAFDAAQLPALTYGAQGEVESEVSGNAFCHLCPNLDGGSPLVASTGTEFVPAMPAYCYRMGKETQSLKATYPKSDQFRRDAIAYFVSRPSEVPGSVVCFYVPPRMQPSLCSICSEKNPVISTMIRKMPSHPCGQLTCHFVTSLLDIRVIGRVHVAIEVVDRPLAPHPSEFVYRLLAIPTQICLSSKLHEMLGGTGVGCFASTNASLVSAGCAWLAGVS
nr:hypothetical protein Iba_chr05dCG3450 [Ipomoea batatas]